MTTTTAPRAVTPLQFGSAATRGDFLISPFQAALQAAVLRCLGKPGRAGLLVQAPVRHGKSYFLSKVLPAWLLVSFPDWPVILAGHGADFAAEFSSAAKELFRAAGSLAGLHVDPEHDRADSWRVAKHAGGLRACGTGSAIQGRGAKVIICDDVVKGRKAAESEVERQSIWQWFVADLLSRREPDGKVIVVQSRWHEDDVAGRIIALKEASDEEELAVTDWEILRIPAIAECDDPLGRAPGEALWPHRFTKEALEGVRREYELEGTPWYWDCLYQQAPSGDPSLAEWPREYFEDHLWFDEFPIRPEDVRLRVLALDPSKTRTSKSGDLASFTDLVLDNRGHCWVRTIASVLPVMLIEEKAVEIVLGARAGVDGFGGRPIDGFMIETNDSQYVIAQNIARRLRAEGVLMNMYGVESREKKEVRIRIDLSSLLAQKRLHLHRGSRGNQFLVGQGKQFPNGKNDDCLDSLSMATRLVNHFLVGGGLGQGVSVLQ